MLELDTLLNPEQLAACTHTGSPLVILAGAGSGKTRVITHRIVYLMLACGAPPDSIVAVTFTNKAAAEMRERVEYLLDTTPGGRYRDVPPDIGTFHAICARLLRRYGERIGLSSTFSIYDDNDQIAIVQESARALFMPADRRAAREFHGIISGFKNDGLDPDAVHERATHAEAEAVAELYALYTERMRAANAVDFGDLILLVNQLLERNPVVRKRLQRRWEHVLVDEFQDTNPVQYRFLRLLSDGGAPLTVVGDDDQSIYKWRGADPRVLLNFTHDFPGTEVVKLEQNYRSTQPILDAASDLISNNTQRLGKRLWTERTGGAPVRVYVARDDREEARFVSRRIRQWCLDEGQRWDSVAVFYRVNAQSRILEEQLRADGVPYRIIGSTAFYARAEIKDLLAYLTVLVNPADDLALKRIINTPTRGIGARTIEALDAMLIAERADAKKRDDEARAAWSLADLIEAMRHGDVEPPARTGQAVVEFAELLAGLRELVDTGATPSRVLDVIIERTDFLAWLDQHTGDRSHETREHVAELLGSILDTERSMPDVTLAEYLQRVSLGPGTGVAPGDDADEAMPGGAVNLMTIHGAKGLEFDLVFVCGLEDELLPYRRRDEEPDYEEERRLCYVAFTRARRELYLSMARYRRLHGLERRTRPSRFLSELDVDTVEWLGLRSDPRELFAPPTARRQAPHPAFNAPRPVVAPNLGEESHFIPDYENESQVVAEPHSQGTDEGLVIELDEISPPVETTRSWRVDTSVSTLDADDSSDDAGDGEFGVGATVTHRSHGIGEVVERDERPNGLMLTVAFQAGIKKVYARFLRAL